MKIKDCRVTYGVLKVNRISSWLKEAKPTVKNVGIDELRDQVIDQFHCNFLLSVLAEELRVGIFEDNFDFHANGEDNHGHVERHKNALAGILWFQFSLNLCNWNEQLLPMVHVKWKSIILAKDAPICEVSDQAD